MKIAALALCLLPLAACSTRGGEPSVDWSQIPQSQHRLIRQAVASGDCQRMQTYFDGSSNAGVLDYLNWHMKKAGCY